MRSRNLISITLFILLISACSPPPVIIISTDTPTPAPATSEPATQTTTAEPLPIPTEEPSTTPPVPPISTLQFIAYVRDGQLLVTDVTNGIAGGTTQYTATGQGDQVQELVWSPSGEFVAFVSPVQGIQHIFYIFAEGDSTPTDLGPGGSPAWSPESQSIAYIGGTYPDENIWVTTIENASARQLSFEANHAWGRPVFTPNGQALVVATADRFNMGAQGNTSFTLEQLALDGSGTRTPLPAATPIDGGRLPYDLHFSPDGTRLAFSTSMHYSACASPGAYYVSDPQGGNRQELVSPSLMTAVDPTNERYHVGLSYAWGRTSDALVATGTVMDCKFDSPTMGQVVAGPQMSILRLDGSEGTVIPGMFYNPSVDRSGTLIAAAHYTELGDSNPNVEIYSAQTGQLVLTVGPGHSPQFQP